LSPEISPGPKSGRGGGGGGGEKDWFGRPPSSLELGVKVEKESRQQAGGPNLKKKINKQKASKRCLGKEVKEKGGTGTNKSWAPVQVKPTKMAEGGEGRKEARIGLATNQARMEEGGGKRNLSGGGGG